MGKKKVHVAFFIGTLNLQVVLAPEELELCCDVGQIMDMVKGMTQTVAFSRCPICVRNFLNHICEYSCSPNQYNFMSDFVVNKTTDGVGTIFNSNKIRQKFQRFLFSEYIYELSIALSERYATETYDSCKGVSNPSSGGLVLDATCGKYASTYCNYQR